MDAIAKEQMDHEPYHEGALDIIPQFIMNCAIAGPLHLRRFYQQILLATPYGGLDRYTYATMAIYH